MAAVSVRNERSRPLWSVRPRTLTCGLGRRKTTIPRPVCAQGSMALCPCPDLTPEVQVPNDLACAWSWRQRCGGPSRRYERLPHLL